MMGGCKGAMSEAKWQGLKFLKMFDEECSAAEFVATLSCSRGAAAAARYRETNNWDPLCVKIF